MSQEEKAETVEDYIDEAMKNIREDRASATILLFDVMNEIKDAPDHERSNSHANLGEIAGKYLDTLQKSNEQLVKIIGLKGKSVVDNTFAGFDDGDKNSLFDSLQKDDDKAK